MSRTSNPRGLGLTTRDRQRLASALRQAPTAALLRRVQAVWLLAAGFGASHAATVTGLSMRAVYQQVHRYVAGSHRIEALLDRPRSGRPPAAPELTEEMLEALLRQPPRALGYRANVWTCSSLCDHLRSGYGWEIAPATLRRRLQALDFRCKRPRYFYAEKEPHRSQKKGPSCAA